MNTKPLHAALKALLEASEQRAVVTAVQHHSNAAAKKKFLEARKQARIVLDELRVLGHLRDLAMAGMSSLTRVGNLNQRDARKLNELEAKYT